MQPKRQDLKQCRGVGEMSVAQSLARRMVWEMVNNQIKQDWNGWVSRISFWRRSLVILTSAVSLEWRGWEEKDYSKTGKNGAKKQQFCLFFCFF